MKKDKTTIASYCITDEKNNRWVVEEFTKLGCSVTICGFFQGMMRNYEEFLFANFGYGNMIKSVKDLNNELHIFSIGDHVKINGWNKELIITGFYINCFSNPQQIGATFEGVSPIKLHMLYKIK